MFCWWNALLCSWDQIPPQIKKVTDDLREQQGDSPNLGSLTIDTRQLGLDRELVVTRPLSLFSEENGKLNSTTVMVKICKEKLFIVP